MPAFILPAGLVGDVGTERAGRRDGLKAAGPALAQSPADPPALAVVECDGRRIRTREPGHGPGVFNSGAGWKETSFLFWISSTS